MSKCSERRTLGSLANERIPLRATISAQIEKAIVDGTYHKGEQLPSEAQLCLQYGVSRVTIRSALQILESKGYVETRRGLGTVVASRGHAPLVSGGEIQSESQVIQVLELRMVFEKSIAGLAATRITEREIGQLQAIYHRMVETAGDPAAFADADFAFHEYLGDVTKNPYIQEAYKGMRINLASAMKRIVALMGTAHGIHDHALLLDAMKAHDKAQAERIMEQHILSTIGAIKQFHPNN